MSSTKYRTHSASEIGLPLVGKTITVAGWVDRRRDLGGMTFLDLRDHSGLLQVVVSNPDLVGDIRAEYVVQITGTVAERPDSQKSDNMVTGDVELDATKVTVLSTSKQLPFQVSSIVENKGENTLPGEDVRLKYRFLDLRRPVMQRRLSLRAKMMWAAHESLHKMNFEEVETPDLIKSTPEGARDFVVPSRLHPGSWYALPQSPELLKQLLMVSGVERYYQFARCFRDEDFRADRQPEFTQLDLEMSYVGQEDVMKVGEQIIHDVWKACGYEVKTPIARISWKDAMDKYGSDKPDLRFGNQLVDLTDYFKNTPFRLFQQDYVGAVLYKGGAALHRRQFDEWQDWVKQRGGKGLAYAIFHDDGQIAGPVAKHLSDEEREGLKQAVHAENGDAVFFSAGDRESSQLLLGMVRREIVRRQGLLDPKKFAFVWVVDFPLFKRSNDPNDDHVQVGHSAWSPMHHPFTMPREDCLDTFDKNPEHAMSNAYDIVCNGLEMGGGSERIHRTDIQNRVLNVLGIGKEEAQEKFGFLLDAFQYGAPPHAGMAFGWDRASAIMAGTDSIRDVIAFPKTHAGTDLLTGAPAPISAEQRAETGVDEDPDEDSESADSEK